MLTEALTLVDQTGVRLWEAELYRLKVRSYANSRQTITGKPPPASSTPWR